MSNRANVVSHKEPCMCQVMWLSQATPNWVNSASPLSKGCSLAATSLGEYEHNDKMLSLQPSLYLGRLCIILLSSSNNWPMSTSVFTLQMKPPINLQNNFLFFKVLCLLFVFLQWSHLRDSYVPLYFPVLKTQDRIKILHLTVYIETYTQCRQTYTRLRNKTFSCLPKLCFL